MINSTKPVYVKGLGKIAYATGSIDEIAEFFDMNFLSGEELAYARVQMGFDSFISRNDSLIKEGVVYIPRWKRIVLTRESLTMEYLKGVLNRRQRAPEDQKSAESITDIFKDEEEYFISNARLNQFIKRAGEESGLTLALNSLGPIRTDNKEDKRAVWLFGKSTESYLNMLNENGVMEIPLSFSSPERYIAKQISTYINQLWVDRIANSSYIYGTMNLDFLSRAFGKIPEKLSPDTDTKKASKTAKKGGTDICHMKLLTDSTVIRRESDKLSKVG